MDDYTVQYNASIRDCKSVPSLTTGSSTIGREERMFEITDLEENSDVSVTLAAVNIVGSSSASVTTTTHTVSMHMSKIIVAPWL